MVVMFVMLVFGTAYIRSHYPIIKENTANKIYQKNERL